jgi:hypothetical protein
MLFELSVIPLERVAEDAAPVAAPITGSAPEPPSR